MLTRKKATRYTSDVARASLRHKIKLTILRRSTVAPPLKSAVVCHLKNIKIGRMSTLTAVYVERCFEPLS